MIRKLLRRIFPGVFSPAQSKRPKRWPTREAMEALPPFEALGLKEITVVDSPEAAHRARAALLHEDVVGFDTESKPTFVKGQVSTGPHVVQISVRHHAYVFILHDQDSRQVACEFIASEKLLKVGFGLSDDIRRIRTKLRVEPQSVIDLEAVLAKNGYGPGVGVKVGVAMALGKRFSKSGRASTSNWEKRHLDDRQVLYAANDAYAALHVYLTLPLKKRPRALAVAQKPH
jgi:ribonuclease D